MHQMTRRDFVTLCTTAALAGAPSDAAAAQTYVYAAESGAPLNSDPFVLGLLITTAPDTHVQRIRELKTRTNYRRVLTHHSTDRFKIPCARELMYYFSRATDLRFTARVVHGGGNDARGWEPFRIAQYAPALTAASLPGGVIVRLKRCRRGWPEKPNDLERQQAARMQALSGLAGVARPELVTLRSKDGLMELAVLLAGALYGTSTPAMHQNPAKAEIARRLLTVLQVPTLEHVVKGKWEPRVTGRRQTDRKAK